MNPVYVEGIGLCGPGLDGWAASLPVLIGMKDYVPAPTHVQPASLLPPNERRRAIQTVKLALAVGAEALAAARLDLTESATVFASSGGDGETIHQIMSVLASSDRELSPTRFHNSVHNTPAGYWGIATAARTPSTSLGCYDGSFAAGLIEAAVQATVEVRPVMLIAYDVPYPAPLGDLRPISAAFAVALVLSPKPTAATLACLKPCLHSATDVVSRVVPSSLEALRCGTPAARSLPLLAALACEGDSFVVIDYLDNMTLALGVTPRLRALPPNGGRQERSSA